MIIKDMKIYVVENQTLLAKAADARRNLWVIVKLISDNGIEGIGEPWGVGFDTKVIVQLLQSVGERSVIGTDPFKTEEMYRKMYSGTPDSAKMSILSAFETACWDIVGKSVDQPIYNLLGGRYNEKLRSYTYLYPDAKDPSQKNLDDVQNSPILAAERAAAYVKMGFTAIKIDPARPAFVNSPIQLTHEALDNAELVIKNVREAVGGKVDIIIGTHGQMTTSSAIRLARRLEKFDPLWFEEPVPPDNKDEMARVGRHTTIPIATGERLSTKYEFRQLLQSQAASILQFALGKVGGILEAKKIAGMAEAFYAQIAPHLYAGPIEAAANIQIDVCSPNFLIQESMENFGGFWSDMLKEPIRWEQGYIIPSKKPGLGIELNEAVMKKYAHKFE